MLFIIKVAGTYRLGECLLEDASVQTLDTCNSPYYITRDVGQQVRTLHIDGKSFEIVESEE